MARSTVYLALAFLLVGALAAPREETNSIEDLENGYFFSNTRIVGGETAAEGEAPHMCAMSTGVIIRSLVCGCSIVSDGTFMTAAHCIDAVWTPRLITGGALQGSLGVQTGTNRWNSGTRYDIAGNSTHPHYVSGTIKNDIGFLFSATRIVFTPTVQPVSLRFDHIPGGKSVTVFGYGRTRAGGPISADILKADLITLGGQECVDRVADHSAQTNIRAPPVEPHIEICTFHSVGRGTCNGDSGSALVKTGTNEQVGVVSWGFPCAIGAPDMFARVSGFEDWVKGNMV